MPTERKPSNGELSGLSAEQRDRFNFVSAFVGSDLHGQGCVNRADRAEREEILEMRAGSHCEESLAFTPQRSLPTFIRPNMYLR